MFCDKKLSFNYSDIPIQLSSDWLDKILPIFQAVMIKYDRESGVREIITKISNDDKFIADYIMDSFQAQIQVDYNPDNDDIQYFADYLMDLSMDFTRRRGILCIRARTVSPECWWI